MYAILDSETYQYVSQGETALIFMDGKEAANKAKELGKPYTVRPYQPLDYDWKRREYSRQQDGTYTLPLPDLYMACTHEHYVHVSKCDPSKLAYTPDAWHGLTDKQKQISVEGYLEKYTEYSGMTRFRLAEEHREAFCTEYRLQFACSPGMIGEVYTNYSANSGICATSCMRHPTRAFKSQVHPVRIYGAGDLAIAFFANEKGQTVARALCWPEKKVYSRVYGNSATTQALHDALKRQGYVKSSGYYGGGESLNLEGARLLKIKSDSYGAFVAPYCDDCETMHESADRKHFVLGYVRGASHSLRQTNGLTISDEALEEENGYCTCERCGDHECDEVYEVNARYGIDLWCHHCREYYAFYCHGDGEPYSARFHASVQVYGETYSLAYARANFIQCKECGEWVTDSDGLDEEGFCASCAEAKARNEPIPYHCNDPAQEALPL